jgi:RNA polymerase sigma-70 factor (ECF subfamily)
MDQQLYQIDLVKGAQHGDRQCLEQLALQARQRLHTYIYRLTQHEDLAEEIVQETLLEMCKVIGKLRKEDRFWPWLYGIALNKLRRYYRTEQVQRRASTSGVETEGTIKERQNGLENLVSEELKNIVSKAMQKLKTRHKAVLVMRCYDGMAYSEIAETIGCTEFGTRMLFMRAKRSLQRELSRNGFSKGALLTALVVFGKITAPSKAAAAQVTVSAAATKVGFLAATAALATTKTAIISLTTAGVLTVGTITVKQGLWKESIQGPPPSFASAQNIGRFGQGSDGGEEYWYYFPQGPAEAMMLRSKSGSSGDSSYWQILQNDKSNYYYHNNTVHINNYHMWASDLSVFKVPTDDIKLTDFINKVEGITGVDEHTPATGKGLLVIAVRDKKTEENKITALRHYNVLDEGYFQADWPVIANTVDNRDQMHKRGWTYFRVTGRINGQNVVGAGQIPFVQSTSEQHSPWLKLQVGSLMIVDTYKTASIYRTSSERREIFKGGSFFKGLARPWLGFHTIDTIRRDAAEQQIWFQTRHASGSNLAEVELDCKDMKLIYKIDLESDVVNAITFVTDQGEKGNLNFSYLQSLDNIGNEFVNPISSIQRTDSKNNPGLSWLVKMVEGSLE